MFVLVSVLCWGQDTVKYITFGSVWDEKPIELAYATDSTFYVLINSGDNQSNLNSNMQFFEISIKGEISSAFSIGSRYSEKGLSMAIADSTIVVSALSNFNIGSYTPIVFGFDLSGEKLFEIHPIYDAANFQFSNLLVKGDSCFGFIESLFIEQNLTIARLNTLDGSGFNIEEINNTKGYHINNFIKNRNGDGFTAVGYKDSVQIDAIVLSFDSNMNLEWIREFSMSLDESYASVDQLSDSSLVIAGYTSSYFDADEDILLHKYKRNGDFILEEIQGYSSSGVNKNDRALDIKVTGADTILLTGFTQTFGAGGHDVFMSRLNSQFEALQGSTTFGTVEDELGVKILPYKNGLVGLGYSSFNSKGMDDVLFWNRMSFDYNTVIVEDSVTEFEVSKTILEASHIDRSQSNWNLISNQNSIQIVCNSDQDFFRLNLFDISGRLVYSNENQECYSTIYMEQPGIYIASLETGKDSQIAKVVLQ